MTTPSWRSDRIDTAEADLFEFTRSVDILARELDDAMSLQLSGAVIVGIEGGWGTGKSTYLRLLNEQLVKNRGAVAATGAPPPTPLRVQFNAWLSCPRGGGTWAALAERIGEAIYDYWRPTDRSTEQLNYHLDERLGRASFTADYRHPWHEIAGRISEEVSPKHWHPALNLFGTASSKLPGRGLKLKTAASQVFPLIGAAFKAAAQKFDSAAKDTGEVLTTFTEAWRMVASRPPAESDEYVRQLNWLLAHLGPVSEADRLAVAGKRGAPHHPQLIVEIEDVSRLDDERLEDLLATLAYLEAMDRTLVLMALDREQADALAAPRSAHMDGESALVRIIHFRQRVPFVQLRHRARLVESWSIEHHFSPPVALQLAFDLVRIWGRAGLSTPRQIQRALLRLNAAVREWSQWDAENWRALTAVPASGVDIANGPLIAGVSAIALVQLTEDKFIDLDALGAGLAALNSEALLVLPMAVWNGRRWPDGGVNHTPYVEGEDALALRRQVRWHAILRDLGAPEAILQRSRRLISGEPLQRWSNESVRWLWGSDSTASLDALLAGGGGAITSQIALRIQEDKEAFSLRIQLTTHLAIGLRELGILPYRSEQSDGQTLLRNWFERDTLLAAQASSSIASFLLQALHRATTSDTQG